MNTYILYWSPEGRPIAEVRANDTESALLKTPKPYRSHLAEVYADIKGQESWREKQGCLPLQAAIALGYRA